MSSTEPTTSPFGVAGPMRPASRFIQAVHTIVTSFGTMEFVGGASPAEGSAKISVGLDLERATKAYMGLYPAPSFHRIRPRRRVEGRGAVRRPSRSRARRSRDHARDVVVEDACSDVDPCARGDVPPRAFLGDHALQWESPRRRGTGPEGRTAVRRAPRDGHARRAVGRAPSCDAHGCDRARGRSGRTGLRRPVRRRPLDPHCVPRGGAGRLPRGVARGEARRPTRSTWLAAGRGPCASRVTVRRT